MTWVVSVGDLRNNLSDYLAKVKAGDNLVVKDKKRDEDVAQIVPSKKFNINNYLKTLSQVAGSVSLKYHPNWATKEKLEVWLRKSRLADDRSF